MRSIICFIDDSEFEHDLVRREIAPCFYDTVFIQTYTFEKAVDELGANAPSLFLLDLWGQDKSVAKPYISTKEELKNKVADFPTLDSVYAGLYDFKGDLNNEYLKRLFSIVDSWRSLFMEVSSRLGQNGQYGLSNLRQARVHYPNVPAVFYTRKSLINDAVAMFKAGADGFFIKPTGKNDDDTRRLTREYAPQLADELKRIIESKTSLK